MANSLPKGVYPCYQNQFQIETVPGVDSAPGTMANIANMVTFSVSIDNGVEEWNAFEEEGWVSRLMTAKGLKITCTGKRTLGDPGNDLVASLYSKNGHDAEKSFQWTFPGGAKVVLKNAIISVTNMGAGDSTGVAPLEFEVMSNGKPVFTDAPA